MLILETVQCTWSNSMGIIYSKVKILDLKLILLCIRRGHTMTTIDGSLAVAGGSSGTGRDTEVSIWGVH